MRSIHQFVDTLVYGDAISNDCMQIHEYLRSLGYQSEIYARTSMIRNRHIHNYKKEISANAGIIFHHSTYSPLVEYVTTLPNRKALIYHNITPAAFFKDYNYSLFKIFREAARQNYLLNQAQFAAIIGDSEYNLSFIKDYIDAPYEAVIPPFLSMQFSHDRSLQDNTKDTDEFRIIFVGRFAPNKKQDDIIKVFEYYSKFLNPKAKLYLLGLYAPNDPYFNEINALIRKRNIQNITIRANLSSDELSEMYQKADVLLSMSEHEGFCIPILESIYFDVPVLAYRIPALEELLDDKYLIDHKDYKKIAERLYSIQTNKKLKQHMIADQKVIFDLFEEKDIKEKFRTFIKKSFHV